MEDIEQAAKAVADEADRLRYEATQVLDRLDLDINESLVAAARLEDLKGVIAILDDVIQDCRE